jgi:hypothetical protein
VANYANGAAEEKKHDVLRTVQKQTRFEKTIQKMLFFAFSISIRA